MADLTTKQIAELDNMCIAANKAQLGTKAKEFEDALKDVVVDIGTINSDIDDLEDAINAIPQVLVAAVAGDIIFKATPATVDADITDQNIGEKQVLEVTIAGVVANDGAGNIDVTVTAEGMTGSPKTVAVALANDDNATTIATKIKAVLDADANIGHVSTGFFTITRTGAVLTFTAKLEAANDTTMDVEVVADDATFETPLSADVVVDEEGVAPYVRTVDVELVDTEGNRHVWFSGTVPVTIADTAAGAAEVVGGLNPEMENGFMQVSVLLRGTWAAGNTNTLSVSQKTILGATVTAKTSVETSVE
jgi:hypothetical protein